MSTEALAVKPDTKELETGLAKLRSEAEAIVVRDQETYSTACSIALAVRKYIKQVQHALNPGIESATEHLNTLRNQRTAYTDPAKQIDEMVSKKAEAWKAEERRKAEAEERRINEERRLEAARIAEAERKERERIAAEERKQREKELEEARKAGEINKRELEKQKKLAAEAEAREKARAAEDAKVQAANVQEVKVEASVPKVAGIKARVNWKYRIVDASKIPHLFLMPNEVAIGQEVRRLKDKAKAEQIIPGIEVWEEDGI